MFVSVIIPTIPKRLPLLNSLLATIENWICWPKESNHEIIIERNKCDGFSKPVNRGIRKSSGDVIWILDDDIVFSRNDALVLMIDKIESFGIVGVSERHGSVNVVPFGCTLISKTTIGRVGYLDEEYVFRGEDCYYCKAAISMGERIFSFKREDIGIYQIENIYPGHDLDKRAWPAMRARHRIIRQSDVHNSGA